MEIYWGNSDVWFWDYKRKGKKNYNKYSRIKLEKNRKFNEGIMNYDLALKIGPNASSIYF